MWGKNTSGWGGFRAVPELNGARVVMVGWLPPAGVGIGPNY